MQDPIKATEAFRRSRQAIIRQAQRAPGSARICLELLIEMTAFADAFGLPLASIGGADEISHDERS